MGLGLGHVIPNVSGGVTMMLIGILAFCLQRSRQKVAQKNEHCKFISTSCSYSENYVNTIQRGAVTLE